MLKIFEENSILQAAMTYWKRFAGWATDLRNKYWRDVFFRTEANVIVLQILFAAIVCAIVAVFFNYLYKNILETIISGIAESIQNHGSITGQEIFDSIQIIKTKYFYSFLSLTIFITLGFSYIIARVTLTPARNAMATQKRFVSDIAHELRTPLSVIKTNIEVALLGEIPNDLQKTLRDSIAELNKISEIMNNLLSFTNLIRPERIQFNRVNMSDIIDMSVKKLGSLSKNKNIGFSIKKTDPSHVWGNATALEQIAVNVLKNAIMYSLSFGTIIITVEPDYRGNVVFSVEDHGAGISQKDLAHIFEPFYRAEKSRNRKSGGSGLGLTIASELVKLHSGKISVKSRVGTGTRVTISLPYMETSEEKTGADSQDEIFIDFKEN